MRLSESKAQNLLESEVAHSPLASLVKWLAEKTDAKRMAKAVDMLKQGSLQLFAEISPEEVVGVIRSQFDAELVYASRLLQDGHYCCTNQHLDYCGGTRGLPCKHMFVLLLGLTQAGQLTDSFVREWMKRTLALPERYRIKMAAEQQAQTFIKYKGAQAGDVDWRPLETIPEDFYAL
jgi:hypothetical protein